MEAVKDKFRPKEGEDDEDDEDEMRRKTTTEEENEDNPCKEDMVDKKLKYNLIKEGCWGENLTGLVKVVGIPQPYRPLPQRRVVKRRWRGSQLARLKPGVFTDQDIRKFFVPEGRVKIQESLNKPNQKKEDQAFEEDEDEDKVQSVKNTKAYEEGRTITEDNRQKPNRRREDNDATYEGS